LTTGTAVVRGVVVAGRRTVVVVVRTVVGVEPAFWTVVFVGFLVALPMMPITRSTAKVIPPIFSHLRVAKKPRLPESFRPLVV
jgi:hypothetical protein